MLGNKSMNYINFNLLLASSLIANTRRKATDGDFLVCIYDLIIETYSVGEEIYLN